MPLFVKQTQNRAQSSEFRNFNACSKISKNSQYFEIFYWIKYLGLETYIFFLTQVYSLELQKGKGRDSMMITPISHGRQTAKGKCSTGKTVSPMCLCILINFWLQSLLSQCELVVFCIPRYIFWSLNPLIWFFFPFSLCPTMSAATNQQNAHWMWLINWGSNDPILLLKKWMPNN